MEKKSPFPRRRNSYRHPSFDYKSFGYYFITIPTFHFTHYFGHIKNGKMELSPIGYIVEAEWLKTPYIRPDMNISLDAWVVMPNHFHGILIIGDNPYNTRTFSSGDTAKRAQCIAPRRIEPIPWEYGCDASHPNAPRQIKSGGTGAMHRTPTNQFGPQSKNLSSIIRGFKSSVTIKARKLNPSFKWQRNFHDHVIRNENALYSIRQYILNNPGRSTFDQTQNP